MTKDQANELKVGIAVLLCVGIGLTVAMKLSNWEQWLEEKNTLTFKVPYQAGIGGIKAGWPVSIGGVTVGSVEEIWVSYEDRDGQHKHEAKDSEVAEGEGEGSGEVADQKPAANSGDDDGEGPTSYSYFRFAVPKKYELRTDCELTPSAQLIGGAGELIITSLGSKGKLLRDGDKVFREDLTKTSMAAMMSKVQHMMNKAQKVIAKAQEAMERVDKITKDLKNVSGNAKTAVIRIKPQLEKIMANVRSASEELKQGIREIRWNPWRLLHNPTDRELRTQNLLMAARTFSSGASDLDTAADKLAGLIAGREGDVADDDPELIEIMEEIKATIAKFSKAEKTFFKRLGK